jgi:hypothetical protein
MFKFRLRGKSEQTRRGYRFMGHVQRICSAGGFNGQFIATDPQRVSLDRFSEQALGPVVDKFRDRLRRQVRREGSGERFCGKGQDVQVVGLLRRASLGIMI